MQRPRVSEARFIELLQRCFSSIGTPLDREVQKALVVFRLYGPLLSYDVTRLIICAIISGKLDEVLAKLKEYYSDQLRDQNPDLIGTIYNSSGVNETEALFREIYQKDFMIIPPSF